MEKWKVIPEFNRFEVSTFGNIRNVITKKLRKPHYSHSGYLKITLRDLENKIMKIKFVHRLVAEAFLDRKNNKTQVNHIDCNKENNKVTNLEWVSASENIRHAVKHGKYDNVNHCKGELVHTALLTEKEVIEIRKAYDNQSMRSCDLAKKYKVSNNCIYGVVKRKNWKHI